MTREGHRDGGTRSGPPPYEPPHVHPASATEPFRQITPPQATPPQGTPHGTPPHGTPPQGTPPQGTSHEEVSYLAAAGPPPPTEPPPPPEPEPFTGPPVDPFADPFAGQGERPWVPGPLSPSGEPPAPAGEPPAPPMPMSAPVPVDQETPTPERLAAPPQPPSAPPPPPGLPEPPGQWGPSEPSGPQPSMPLPPGPPGWEPSGPQRPAPDSWETSGPRPSMPQPPETSGPRPSMPQPPGVSGPQRSMAQAGAYGQAGPGVGPGIVGEDEAVPPPMPRARRPLGKRLLSGVVGLALLGGAFVARAYVPDEFEQRYAPLLEKGEVGRQVATDRFSFKVTGVHSARVIGWDEGIGGREKAATDGVFVIIEAQATTAKEPKTLRAANLVTADETRFDPMDKALLANLMEEQQMHPGYWTPSAYVFEVPAGTDLTGARLQVSDDKLQPSNFAAGASVIVPGYGVEIDLGLDAAKAKRLVQQPEAGRLLPKDLS